jgi:hypothetical protein
MSVTPRSSELSERLARLRAPDASPSGEDLDWFLFRSFPDCEVSATCFRELLPVYATALERGARFDFELLFVRAIELRDASCDETCVAIARAAAQRVLDAQLDPADAISALRYGSRVLPDPEAFWIDWTARGELARMRFEITLDFALDERGLDDYWTLAYLTNVAIDAAVRDRIAAFFEEDACRARLEEGWRRWIEPSEEEFLASIVTARFPGLAITPASRTNA